MNNIIFKPIIPTLIMLIASLVIIGLIVLNKKNLITRIAIVIILFIISQRPMLLNGAGVTYNLDIDVLFVIDNTMSMNAIDVSGDTRLKALVTDCKHIINQMPGANFAIITFNNYSQVRVPFTTDAQIAIDVLNNLQIVDPSYATGSTLSLPYDDMKTLLMSSKSKAKHHRVVFFISDGELTNKEKLSLDIDKYKDLRDLVDNGAILGYGTSEGGKIKVTEGVNLKGMVDSDNFLLDKSKNPVEAAISKMDEANLKQLANTLSLDYIHMNVTNNINRKLADIKNNATVIEKERQSTNQDIYYFFSFVLLALLVYELYYYRRSMQ